MKIKVSRKRCMMVILIIIMNLFIIGCNEKSSSDKNNDKNENQGKISIKHNALKNDDAVDYDSDSENHMSVDVDSFGRYKLIEVDYSNEDDETVFVDYYSGGKLEEVLSHYEDLLKGSDEYYSNSQAGGFTAEITGTVNGIYVNFVINKHGEDDKETYINFWYEKDTLQAENNENDMSSEEMKEEIKDKQDQAVEDVTNGSEIIIRKEIGEFDLKELKEDFLALDFPYSMTVTVSGVSTSTEFGADDIAYKMTFRGEDVHILTFLNGEHVGVTIYNSDNDLTCVYTTMDSKYKEVTSGNSVPLRLLDIEFFETFDKEALTVYIETDDGQRFIWVSTLNSSFMYSFDDRIIKWYHEAWSDTEGTYTADWKIIDIEYDVEIVDSLFEW